MTSDNKKTTKELVREFLESNSRSFVSGQEIADSLFITRAAVWKAVKALTAEGCEITAVSNKGYRYEPNDDRLSVPRIRKLLAENMSNVEIKLYDSLESTNDTAREFAGEYSDRDLLIISDSQTKGRGRRGRSFYSPKGSGLYLSLLIHPDLSPERATMLTCLTAVAITDAVKEVTDIDLSIKWVNDLFLADRKVAGILTEAVTSVEDINISYVIIGLGINLYPPEEGFPEELRKLAGVLLPHGGQTGDLRNRLVAAFLNAFGRYYREFIYWVDKETLMNMNEENAPEAPEEAADLSQFAPLNNVPSFIDRYRSASCLIGRYVRITSVSREPVQRYAYVTGIDDSCHLLVRYDDGRTDRLLSGEVSVVKY